MMMPPYYLPPQQPALAMPELETQRNIEYPLIASCLRYLDSHDGRNNDGVKFSDYGQILKAKGFVRLSQLNREYFSVQELASWLNLGDRVGTALLIMQHAKTNIDAIKIGQLFILSIPYP